MDPERRRQIASAAGKASQASGHANRFTRAQARTAGKKGGLHSGIVRSRKKAERERGAAPPAMLEPEAPPAGPPTGSGTVAQGRGPRDV